LAPPVFIHIQPAVLVEVFEEQTVNLQYLHDACIDYRLLRKSLARSPKPSTTQATQMKEEL
jgi:hypothetical protein